MDKLHIHQKKLLIVLVIIIVLLIVLGIFLAVIPTRMSSVHTEKIVDLYANDTGYEIEEFEGKYGTGEETVLTSESKYNMVTKSLRYTRNRNIFLHIGMKRKGIWNQ